jgi:ATP-dependent protease ClpP protease subunit
LITMSEITFRQQHSVRFEQQRGIVRFCGPVDTAQIFALCDEIDSLIDHYFYNHITLEIDSNGGELQSLLYYIQKLKGWRRDGVRIETVALTQCASAAALMLSFGDIGHRYAMPRSKILYHNARVYSSNQIPLTSESLEKLRSSLSRADAELLVALLNHLFSELGENHFIYLEELVCNLPYPEHAVDGMLLLLQGNPRIGKFINALEQAKGDEEKQYLRNELYRSVSNHLKGFRDALKDLKNMSELQKILDAEPVENRDELAMAWLYGRFEHYRNMFERDVTMKPEEVMAEGLIDRIQE